jgi:ribosomal protein S27E
MICSVFKNIDNIRSELNQMLDYSGAMADVMPDFTPTKELWKYLASRCYFYTDKIHEQKHTTDIPEYEGDFDTIKCKKCGNISKTNEDDFAFNGDEDTITCESCGYEFTMSYQCPNCHEESVDNLIWDETGISVECKNCGTTYQPFGKKE